MKQIPARETQCAPSGNSFEPVRPAAILLRQHLTEPIASSSAPWPIKVTFQTCIGREQVLLLSNFVDNGLVTYPNVVLILRM